MEKIADLLHLGDPAVGLLVHAGNLTREPRQQRRLARREFGMESLRDPGTARTEHHRRAERGQTLGDPSIGHFERACGADAALYLTNIESMCTEHQGVRCRLA